jgi:hypothetical protein
MPRMYFLPRHFLSTRNAGTSVVFIGVSLSHYFAEHGVQLFDKVNCGVSETAGAFSPPPSLLFEGNPLLLLFKPIRKAGRC